MMRRSYSVAAIVFILLLFAAAIQPPMPFASAQSNSDADPHEGSVRFAFVDSFWTDSVALGSVVASTSSETVSVNPLPPVAKRETEAGQGEAILAVVLRNKGSADATSISASLDFPSGFNALVTPEDVDSDTALASYNGVVAAGRTITLYFRVEITDDAEVDREYEGDLRIRYVVVGQPEDTRSTTIEVPFRLTGTAILSAQAVAPDESGQSDPGVVSVSPGSSSTLEIEIRNDGTAPATRVVANIAAAGQQTPATNGNGSQIVPPRSVPLVIVGSSTFNIGELEPDDDEEINPVVFVSDAAAGTLTTLNIQITYNDAYGNQRVANQIVGIQVSPESPQSGLNISPSVLDAPTRQQEVPLTLTTLSPSTAGNATAPAGNDTAVLSQAESQPIKIQAGSIQDLKFAVTKDPNVGGSVTDATVTLTSESNEVRILGNSRWSLESLPEGSRQELSTQVYASTAIIGNPVFFTVTMEYIQDGNELRTDTFQLGAVVVGEIRIRANDLAISYIGDTPNLSGNLLNEGNTPALFATIELVAQDGQSLQPAASSSQYLGDLPVNSPVAFNIPLAVPENATGQTYPVLLRITYSDELRNTQEQIINGTVSLENLQAGEALGPGEANTGFVDAYWAQDASSAVTVSNTSGQAAGQGLPSEREVGPGEGQAFLAVVLSNTAFSDITGIIGYLRLPEGFTSATSDQGQTAIASVSGVVRAGQTYTLYFRVNVQEDAQIGLHRALLEINYFKVPEPQPGTYRVQTITVPFELAGKVVLDASPETTDLLPGETNEVTINIRNRGSADARSVIVTLDSIGGSIIAGDGGQVNGNASDNETGQPSAPAVSLGARTFNIGTIPAGESAEITTIVFPSSAAGGTLQNLDVSISYNDANGDPKSTAISLGFRVSPNPPDGGLSVTPSAAEGRPAGKIIFGTIITGSPDGSTGNASGAGIPEATIVAGRADDLSFNITNNNNNPVTDVVVTLTPRSDSLEILGDSRWTLPSLEPHTNARFSTQVFASESLIGNPVSFEVGIQYISGDELKSETLSLGANVMGEIRITVTDLQVSYIAGTPSLTGNLLNQGNTMAFFTTIEMEKPTSNSSLVPLTDEPQYLGDLEENSPLPFTIPLAYDGGRILAGQYPVSLLVTYSDELRDEHEFEINSVVAVEPPAQEEQQPAQSRGQLGDMTGVIVIGLIMAVAVVAAIVIIRMRRKRVSRLASKDEDYEPLDEYRRSERDSAGGL
ncbi:MAG TPA: hypothetical protein VF172_07640 [Nitrososphaera sp.]|jgi:hypothetical protein